MQFCAANGTGINIYGEQEIRGKDNKGYDVKMRMTCADVKKPLASVMKIVKKGNRVVFDEESYVENKKTGIKTPVREEGGVYVFDIWVPTCEGKMKSGDYGRTS